MIQLPKRQSVRLPGYDYSLPGWYYITICTNNRECLFGEIIDKKMVLNDVGKIIKNEWLKTKKIRKNVKLDKFQIMPNHIHGIIIITHSIPRRGVLNTPVHVLNTPVTNKTGLPKQTMGLCNKPLRPPSNDLGAIIRGFKPTTVKQIRKITNNLQTAVWQRNFYEYIIRNQTELEKIQEYIGLNPQIWGRDRNNPDLGKEK